jgi:branched-subunit amino acid aminotransferase/4-amino-4-deoxychorismate lyase
VTSIGDVLIDGERVDQDEAVISVFDTALLRGIGCFEALKSYGGVAFRQRQHLDRMENSAAALGLRLPPRADMERWVADRAAEGDCGVRVVATGGTGETGERGDSRFIVFAQPLPPPAPTTTLRPVEAPWHPDGVVSELTGAKTLSYGPNMAARERAHAEGFGDALLVGRSGNVLEGPTNTVAWVVDGVVETPSLDLGILASITRGAMFDVAAELGVEIREGHYPLARMVNADEAISLSTFREIQPVLRIADTELTEGPVTKRLAEGLDALIRRETDGRGQTPTVRTEPGR